MNNFLNALYWKAILLSIFYIGFYRNSVFVRFFTRSVLFLFVYLCWEIVIIINFFQILYTFFYCYYKFVKHYFSIFFKLIYFNKIDYTGLTIDYGTALRIQNLVLYRLDCSFCDNFRFITLAVTNNSWIVNNFAKHESTSCAKGEVLSLLLISLYVVK